MRLIDKDEILNLIGAIVSKFPEEYDEKTYKMIRRVIRDKRQEVGAIPIEWIEKWLEAQERIVLISPPYYNQVRVPKMLEDWRAEHEVNRR